MIAEYRQKVNLTEEQQLWGPVESSMSDVQMGCPGEAEN